MITRPGRSASRSVLFFHAALILSVSVFLLAAATPRAEANVVKIMPIGDSITSGSNGHGTYRYWLWKDLQAAGYQVDFVGTLYGVYNGQPPFPDFDQDHEGHSGWRADEAAANIAPLAQQEMPDIVLIHLGHNDIAQGQSHSTTIADLGLLIDNLRSVNPKVTILLSKLVTSTVFLQIPSLNAQIPGLASSKTQPNSPVIVIDHPSVFDPSTDTYDGVHPNNSGEMKMAGQFYNALTTELDNWKTCCDYSVNPNPANQTENVLFNASASFHPSPNRSIINYDWSWGDGQFGAGVNASHAYSAVGTYTVVLTLTDNFFNTTACSTEVTVLGPLPVEPTSWGRIKQQFDRSAAP